MNCKTTFKSLKKKFIFIKKDISMYMCYSFNRGCLYCRKFYFYLATRSFSSLLCWQTNSINLGDVILKCKYSISFHLHVASNIKLHKYESSLSFLICFFLANELSHYLLRMAMLTSTANVKRMDDPANSWQNDPHHILIHTQTLQDPLLITWPWIHPFDVLTDWHGHFITTIRVLSLIFVRLIQLF